MKSLTFAVCMMLVCCDVVFIFAQGNTTSIYGTVTLADGSHVPGVLLTLTGDTIGKRTTISSRDGNFRFLNLPPGSYELKAELEGFKTVIRKGLRLQTGKSLKINILLETTTLKEEITVYARAGVVDTRSTQCAVINNDGTFNTEEYRKKYLLTN